MRNIVVSLDRTADLAATMAAMRVWLDDNRCQPALFICDQSPGSFVIRININDHLIFVKQMRSKLDSAAQKENPQAK